MARPKKAAVSVDDVADDVSDSLPALVQESAIQLIPYGRLKRAPENVRKTDIAADVESLADDIAAHGLLQSLIGYRWNPRVEDSTVFIVGGGRRLQALDLLRERKDIGEAFNVPVLIRPQAEAIEISLSENLARRDMNPADEFTAFDLLLKPGTLSPADLAKRFGFTERYVKQRLRLAGLIPDVLDGLRDGKMTFDAALAYAQTQDKTLQLKVFKAQEKQGSYAHQARSVRDAISNAQMKTDDALFKFVGAESYEKAGGNYEDDLFFIAPSWEGDRRRLSDPQILVGLATDLAAIELQRVADEAKQADQNIADVLLAPGIRWGKAPKCPAGYKMVERNYYGDWPSYAEMREKAAAIPAPVVGIASINTSGKLVLEDRFFIANAHYAAITPPAPGSAPQKTAEEYAAERRATAIRSTAAWLAARKIREDKIDGRTFWETTSPNLWRSRTVDGIGECWSVGLDVLVTADEIDAQLADAEAEYERQEAEKVAAREAAEQAKADAAAALDARRAELVAMAPVPEVVLIDRLAFYRWANGTWAEEPEDSEEEPEYGYDDLAEALADAGDIGAAYATVADYHAAIAESNGDAPAEAVA